MGVGVFRAEMICEQERPTVHEMLKNGIVTLLDGEGVVLDAPNR